MRRFTPILALLALVHVGCDDDCEDESRSGIQPPGHTDVDWFTGAGPTLDVRPAADVDYWALHQFSFGRIEEAASATGGQPCPQGVSDAACQDTIGTALRSAVCIACSSPPAWDGWVLLVGRDGQLEAIDSRETFLSAIGVIDTDWEAVMWAAANVGGEPIQVAHEDAGYSVVLRYFADVCFPITTRDVRVTVGSDGGAIETVDDAPVAVRCGGCI